MESKDLVLPASEFGEGWELTQHNNTGTSSSPNYINRSLPHQPVVMINIISFASAVAAKEKWDKKFSAPGASEYVKKVDDMSDAYDYLPPAHNKRFILIKNYWLTIEQVGEKDDRGVFIQKYYAHLKRKLKI